MFSTVWMFSAMLSAVSLPDCWGSPREVTKAIRATPPVSTWSTSPLRPHVPVRQMRDRRSTQLGAASEKLTSGSSPHSPEVE